jgi:cell division protein ZapE
LQFDAAQAHAAARLDRLAAELRDARGSWLDGWRARLGWTVLDAGNGASRGLYLWGGVGRGKTLLMDAFFASLGSRVPGERSHFYRFMRGVHADLARVKGRENPLDLVARRIAKRVRALCLDEFFVADIADAMILKGLLEALFRRGVTLVATSNLAPRDLYIEGLQRARFLPAIALIETHLEVLEVDSGIDYRLRRLEQAPTYLDSGSPDAPAEMRRRFAALAGGPALPATLEVEGRPIHALGAGPDIAWFEFSELCEGPRSQNDYIELATLYGTVFISGIPIFTPAHEDAARRFIMLIDELYDRGVKTLVSAAAGPDELYRGERLRLEFRRAASRLVEMQTQAYLAGRHHA